MERQSNIGGESFRNRDVLNEDRISELPEALLLHILSSLPLRTVIKTSVLSKRWKSLWKLMPNLKFDSRSLRKFPEDVCSSLILHKAPVLESLNLLIRRDCDPLEEMGLPIAIAFSRNVLKLVIKLDEDRNDEVIFPGLVFRCSNTLQILKLMGDELIVDLTTPVCLNSLKELHIYNIQFKDDESFSNLLCGCPRLQELVMDLVDFVDAYSCTIAVPSLQRLTLHIADCNGGFVINAPALKYLNIDFYDIYDTLQFCVIENAPEIVEAKCFEVFNAFDDNIFESLVSAKRLSLSLSPLKMKSPTGKIFYQLLSLELLTNREEWWNLLFLLLDSSPKLQILKLMDIDHIYVCTKPYLIGQIWNQPKHIPECLLFHLETFVWTNYKWRREDEKEVATYILKNARHLKKATFSTAKTRDLPERCEMLNQLVNEVRASHSCDLVFKFDEDYVKETDADLAE